VRRHVADAKFTRVQYDPREYPEWAGETFPDYTRMAVWYCEEVIAGRVPTTAWETMACERFLRMKRLAESGRAPYYWDDACVTDCCSFLEELRHVKGFEGKIVLEPVQCFWVAAIMGFRDQETDLRWTIAASWWIPRKNAKSTLAVGLVFYCLNFEDEPGAECVISAGTEDQAKIPYTMMTQTIDAVPMLKKHLQVSYTQAEMNFNKTGAKIKVATSVAKNKDGENPHVVLAEELHAQNQDLIGVLRTAMGSRRNPLFLTISTAGRDVNAPAYSDWQSNIDVLEGKQENDRLFCVIYAADKSDEGRAFDLSLIEKVNPLWGVSLFPASIEQEKFEARKNEAKRNEYLRTRLTIWSRAAGNLISVPGWNLCATKLSLRDLQGYRMFVGIDLASRSDLNAATFLVEVDDCLFAAFRYWLPRHAERMRDDRFAEEFLKWHREGHLQLTDLHGGTYADHRVILNEITEMVEGHNVIGFAIDDYQANIMASEIELKGHAVYFVKKTARELTPSTDDVIARVGNVDLLQHDGNPISSWCAGNVVGRYDENDNVLPKKATKGSKANIDGMDSLILANAIRLEFNAGTLGKDKSKVQLPNPFLKRGLIGHAA
jgi:phage terminase large subunit-like protein